MKLWILESRFANRTDCEWRQEQPYKIYKSEETGREKVAQLNAMRAVTRGYREYRLACFERVEEQ